MKPRKEPSENALQGGDLEEINPILDESHINDDDCIVIDKEDKSTSDNNVKETPLFPDDTQGHEGHTAKVAAPETLRQSPQSDGKVTVVVEMLPVSHVSISQSSPAILDHLTVTGLPTNGVVSNSARSLLSHSGSGAICLEEVVPTNCQLEEEEEKKDFWKMSLDAFTSKWRGKTKADKKLPKSVRSYYQAQDDLIKTFEETADFDRSDDLTLELEAKDNKIKHRSNVLAKVTLGINLILLIAKLAASILSGSLVVISSLVDSAVDLMSGIVIWWTSRAVRKRNRYVYPEGKTRLEPIAIVILSVIMSVASVQLIGQSIQSIVSMAGLPGQEGAPVMDIPTVVIIGFTIVSKLILFLACKAFRSPMIDALAQDHRNDVFSNAGALTFGYIAYKLWKYCDPLGAILMSIYIFISWWMTGAKQIKMLTGYTAKPHFLKKLTWVCLNHSEEIRYIDTVRAFHFGTNYIVEVDIVLPENMTVKEAHNIGEPLQQKLEKMPNVERAFVHLDYEFEHDPNTEHKVV
ncbi:uncharacterized protein LOC135496803 [Lineus longissimus]|uniref:uncharacterized protein LOC135496803 n=1 Tax=Lineus longissimus TaxID=88925 RepID=UPI002B4D975C